MCKIKIIYKNLEEPTKEFEIKVDKECYPSLETPYYVVVNKTYNVLRMEFAYATNTTQTDDWDMEEWSLIFGNSTGRIFIAICRDFNENSMIPYGYIKRAKKTNWNNLKLQNFSMGTEILEAIIKYLHNMTDFTQNI